MKSEPRNPKSLRNWLLYNGSSDERNQGIYNKAGYFGYLFLMVGIFAEMLVRTLIFKVDWVQTLPEFSMVVLSAIFTTTLVIGFGATGFENLRQKKSLRVFLVVFTFGAVALAGWTSLGLNLPQAAWMTQWGNLAWLIPPGVGLGMALVFWAIVEGLSRLMNSRAERLQK